jgi:hypothetical protein
MIKYSFHNELGVKTTHFIKKLDRPNKQVDLDNIYYRFGNKDNKNFWNNLLNFIVQLKDPVGLVYYNESKELEANTKYKSGLLHLFH